MVWYLGLWGWQEAVLGQGTVWLGQQGGEAPARGDLPEVVPPFPSSACAPDLVPLGMQSLGATRRNHAGCAPARGWVWTWSLWGHWRSLWEIFRAIAWISSIPRTGKHTNNKKPGYSIYSIDF